MSKNVNRERYRSFRERYRRVVRVSSELSDWSRTIFEFAEPAWHETGLVLGLQNGSLRKLRPKPVAVECQRR